METALDTLDKSVRIPLSVTFIARYLQAGKSQADIARIANVSNQAVSDYIQRRIDIFQPLLSTDSDLSLLSKGIAIKAQLNIDKALDKLTIKEAKKNLVPLNIISGTHIDKYRLLSGASTQNVAFSGYVKQVAVNTREALKSVNKPDNVDK